MSLEERIPDLSDTELANLHANAARLEHSGTPKQQLDAATLLPLVTAEQERRRATSAAARVRKTPERVATAKRKAPVRKAVAKKRKTD